MRETHNAQAGVFDFYSEHDTGKQLKELSDVLDQHSQLLDDGVRVLSRLMSYSKTRTGVKIHFVDQIWKGHDGFTVYVRSAVLSYNLTRMVRFSSA